MKDSIRLMSSAICRSGDAGRSGAVQLLGFELAAHHDLRCQLAGH